MLNLKCFFHISVIFFFFFLNNLAFSKKFSVVAFLFFFLLNYLFIYLWLCWVFVSARGLSLAVASGGHSSSRCAGLSLSQPLLLRSTGCRRAGSAIVAHGSSCSAACGILPDQGPNPRPLHWQADPQPLRHQGSPVIFFWCLLVYMRIKVNCDSQFMTKSHFSLFKFITISSCFLCDYSQNKLWVEARETWKEKYHGTEIERSLSRGERKQNWGEMVGNIRRKGMDGK